MNFCQQCNTQLEKSLRIDYLVCPKCGIYYKLKEYYPSDRPIEQQVDYYLDNLVYREQGYWKKHINDLYHHQVEVYKNEYLEQLKKEKIEKTPKRVISLAGGLPKLELFFNPEAIEVYDLMAFKFWFHPLVFPDYIFKFNYQELAPNLKSIKFEERMVNPEDLKEIVGKEMNSEYITIFTFVHFFEHTELDYLLKFLKEMRNLRGQNYFIIYQPNPETINGNKKQLHFDSALDHITLIPKKTMEEIIKAYNFTIVDSRTTGLDMFLVFKN